MACCPASPPPHHTCMQLSRAVVRLWGCVTPGPAALLKQVTQACYGGRHRTLSWGPTTAQVRGLSLEHTGSWAGPQVAGAGSAAPPGDRETCR